MCRRRSIILNKMSKRNPKFLLFEKQPVNFSLFHLDKRLLDHGMMLVKVIIVYPCGLKEYETIIYSSQKNNKGYRKGVSQLGRKS